MSEQVQFGLGIEGQLKRRVAGRIVVEEKVEKKKRKKPFAANRASVKFLEAAGWFVGKVEQRLPYCFITVDLFNFIDLVAIHPERGILAVQSTTAGNMMARVAKIKAEPRAAVWLKAGGKIQVHGWHEVGPIGQRKTWQLKAMTVSRIDAEIPLPGLAPGLPAGDKAEKGAPSRPATRRR